MASTFAKMSDATLGTAVLIIGADGALLSGTSANDWPDIAIAVPKKNGTQFDFQENPFRIF